jgi:Kef-type K+ transport system membrane component KefB
VSRRGPVPPGRRPPRCALGLLVCLAGLCWPALALAGEGAAAHEDPAGLLVLRLALILVVAKLGGHLAVRLRQPSVLGELLAGVVLGNLALQWPGALSAIGQLKADPTLPMLAQVGILLLLFEVGLESTVGQMLRVGLPSLLVATLGVLAPFGLGYLAARALLPAQGAHVHAFVGATLTATSVGITARVLKDLGCQARHEARVILGAAVIDDVLGLVILAVVSGVIQAQGGGAALGVAGVGLIVGKALAFLVAALVLGVYASRRLFSLASRLQAQGVLLGVGLSFCFFLAALSSRIGLAPIVGAFAAGLILEDVHYKSFVDKGEHPLEELVHPITSFLLPIFFVLMGMNTDLRVLLSPGVPLLAAALTAVAIGGKLICGLGAVGGPAVPGGVDRLSIGIGMIPRGEVGLIFIDAGRRLTMGGEPVVGPVVFSAVVIMVIVTTLVTPPALGWSLRRRGTAG